ncbi:polysaccharide biosynthesis/export family protein [bacterium]|nr:polysaccharide biosynthesis/export family protein [bacterium]
MCAKHIIWVVLVSVLVAWYSPAAAQSSEYIIGAGDLLTISVWRHPELDRPVTVRSNGLITFPPVGEMMAQGLTATSLGRELTQRLRDYTRETNQVTVTIDQFRSRSIFLTGQVALPGRYSFEQIPDILQVMSQAGGPLPSADLAAVSIIRPTRSGPEVIGVDLAAYMRGGRTEPLPELLPGDTIEFPAIYGGGMTGPGLIYIIGEVHAPGAYPSTEQLDVIQALALAGGPTRDAALSDIVIIMDGGESQVAANIDVSSIAKHGTGQPFYLAAGDRVIVPAAGTSIGEVLLTGAGSLLDATREVLQAYLLYLSVDRSVEERRLEKQIEDLQNQ